jgi:hypothetical protein
MTAYPLTRTERTIVAWGGRAIAFVALTGTLLLGLMTLVAS